MRRYMDRENEKARELARTFQQMTDDDFFEFSLSIREILKASFYETSSSSGIL